MMVEPTTEKTEITAEPIYFGPAERRLFGWFYPASAPTNRPSILICKPIGYEALCSHAALRHLAERLSAAGHPTLRFDYDGTGDSSGDDSDPGRLPAWRASIHHAIDALQQRTGSEVILLGVRLGATLAALAASERTDIRGLILWAPCRSGKAFLREIRAISGANRVEATGDGQADAMTPIEACGFVYSPETICALADLDLMALPDRPASNVLLISRDDLPDDPRLSQRFQRLGCRVTDATWPGYAGMMRDPQDVEIPVAAIDGILRYLDDPFLNTVPGELPRPESPAAAPRLVAGGYTEEPIVFPGSQPAFGILTGPGAYPTRPDIAVLLLTVGAFSHVGPNRMYVTLARRLAAVGFPTVRLDVPGIGDSAVGAVSGRDRIYSSRSNALLAELLPRIAEHLGVSRFAVIGLCSGAFLGFQLTRNDSRVVSQILINLPTFEWNESDTLESMLERYRYKRTANYLNGVTDRRRLQRLFTAQVDFRGIWQSLYRRYREQAGDAAKHLLSLMTHGRPHETEACRALRRIAQRHTETLFLYAEEDIGLDVMQSHLGPNARKVRKHTRVECLPGADHTLSRAVYREQALSLILSYLTDAFPESPAFATIPATGERTDYKSSPGWEDADFAFPGQ